MAIWLSTGKQSDKQANRQKQPTTLFFLSTKSLQRRVHSCVDNSASAILNIFIMGGAEKQSSHKEVCYLGAKFAFNQ